jgi:hypothetical protein
VNLAFFLVLDPHLLSSVLDVLSGANVLGPIRARSINSRAGSPSTDEAQRRRAETPSQGTPTVGSPAW